jgi:hypothetical protein
MSKLNEDDLAEMRATMARRASSRRRTIGDTDQDSVEKKRREIWGVKGKEQGPTIYVVMVSMPWGGVRSYATRCGMSLAVSRVLARDARTRAVELGEVVGIAVKQVDKIDPPLGQKEVRLLNSTEVRRAAASE